MSTGDIRVCEEETGHARIAGRNECRCGYHGYPCVHCDEREYHKPTCPDFVAGATTQQADWIKEREAIRARVEAVSESWELETDQQYIREERRHYIQQRVMNGDGKRLFDADNSDDVVLDRTDEGYDYDLNAHNRLTLAAHAPEDLRRLLAKSEEDGREIHAVLDSIPAAFRIISRPSAGAENIYESLAISVAKMSAELASREQRIDFQGKEIQRLTDERNQLAIAGADCEQRISELEAKVFRLGEPPQWMASADALLTRNAELESELAILRKANEESIETALAERRIRAKKD